MVDWMDFATVAPSEQSLADQLAAKKAVNWAGHLDDKMVDSWVYWTAALMAETLAVDSADL